MAMPICLTTQPCDVYCTTDDIFIGRRKRHSAHPFCLPHLLIPYLSCHVHLCLGLCFPHLLFHFLSLSIFVSFSASNSVTSSSFYISISPSLCPSTSFSVGYYFSDSLHPSLNPCPPSSCSHCLNIASGETVHL